LSGDDRREEVLVLDAGPGEAAGQLLTTLHASEGEPIHPLRIPRHHRELALAAVIRMLVDLHPRPELREELRRTPAEPTHLTLDGNQVRVWLERIRDVDAEAGFARVREGEPLGATVRGDLQVPIRRNER